MKAPRETDIQRAIMQMLSLHGILHWRNQTVGIWDAARGVYRTNPGAKGAMDILGVLPGGKFLGIEVKRPGGNVSPEQLASIDNINRAGGIAFVARSVADVEAALRAEGYL